jgi:hypothetical protein
MGKAFAIVFGSTSALALVFVLFVLVIRPVLRPWMWKASTEKPPVAPHEAQILRLCREWNEKGQCADPTANEWNLSLGDCSKDGCFVYSSDLIVGYISHKQLMNMNEPQYQHQPGFTPVQPSLKR